MVLMEVAAAEAAGVGSVAAAGEGGDVRARY
jgi:hypothetical protein